jgi:hypothetical protein
MSDPFAALFGAEKQVESEDDKIKRYLLEGTGINPDTKYKLNMFDALKAMDNKDRSFYDNLNDQEKKGFSPFVMVRWASAVNHSMTEMDEWWVKATNQRFNTNMIDLMSGESKHPKLVWLMSTTASPGMGAMKHQWIGYKKKDKTAKTASGRLKTFAKEQFPTMSDDEIELLLSITPKKEIKQYAIDLGYNDKAIKDIFK